MDDFINIRTMDREINNAAGAYYRAKQWGRGFPKWKPQNRNVVMGILNSKQGGKCACCGCGVHENRGMGLDHDHKTGKARGVICRNCNLAIGFIHDDPAVARGIAAYLETHEE